MHIDLHLPARDVDVDGVIIVGAGIDGIGGRRGGKLLHLGPHRLNPAFGFLQGLGQPVILLVRLLQLRAGLIEPAHFLFERPDLD